MNPGGPGWNDPPSLSYETHSQTTARRNLLTKRVGLPDLKLPSSQTPDAENVKKTEAKQDSVLPPPPSGPPISPQKSENSSRPGNTNESKIMSPKLDSKPVPKFFNPMSPQNSSDDTVNATTTIFNPAGDDQLEESNHEKETKTSEEADKIDFETMEIVTAKELKNIVEECQNRNIFSKQVGQTILKKIEIFEKQLNDEKLPKIVAEKMNLLTKCLMSKKHSEAWDIHVALVCDYSSNVMQWMSGIKKLISEAKKL